MNGFYVFLAILLFAAVVNLAIKYYYVSAIIILVIGYMVYKEKKDRKENPEKWREIDKKAADELKAKEERERPEVAANFYKKYSHAMRRIPKSEWILMNREEKSNIHKERESVINLYDSLPAKTQILIRKSYNIDMKLIRSMER